MLLTTHYMAEADELCERIAIVDHGRILAIGSPAELKRRVQRESIFRLELDRLDGGPAALARLPGVVCAVAATGEADVGPGDSRRPVIVNLVLGRRRRARRRRGGARSRSAPTSWRSRSRSRRLEDVFVELVGRGFEDEAGTRRPPDDGLTPAVPGAHEAGEPELEEVV